MPAPHFKTLLEIAQKKRNPLLKWTDAYRIANGSEDGLPGVAVDRYGDAFQIQYFGAGLLPRQNELTSAVEELFSPKFLVSKFRLSPSGKSLENPEMRVERGSETDAGCIVKEGNCRFRVNLLDTVNPGLFLDMRSARLDVENLSAGREILNLFSYTCAFSVHARSGGATRSVNVDISGKALEKGRENYRLNGMEIRPGEFFKGDSREYLAYCKRKGVRFGGLVLDPPSFSHNRKKTFSVKNEFQSLVEAAASVLAPGAFLLAGSNYSGFEKDAFSQETLTTVKRTFPRARIVWVRGQGIDFPGSGTRKESSLSTVLIEAGEAFRSGL